MRINCRAEPSTKKGWLVVSMVFDDVAAELTTTSLCLSLASLAADVSDEVLE